MYLSVSHVLLLLFPGEAVPCPWGFPGPLLRAAVVVEVSAILVFVSLPVAIGVERREGRKWRGGGLRDLQFLQVCVNRRVRPALP